VTWEKKTSIVGGEAKPKKDDKGNMRTKSIGARGGKGQTPGKTSKRHTPIIGVVKKKKQRGETREEGIFKSRTVETQLRGSLRSL